MPGQVACAPIVGNILVLLQREEEVRMLSNTRVGRSKKVDQQKENLSKVFCLFSSVSTVSLIVQQTLFKGENTLHKRGRKPEPRDLVQSLLLLCLSKDC